MTSRDRLAAPVGWATASDAPSGSPDQPAKPDREAARISRLRAFAKGIGVALPEDGDLDALLETIAEAKPAMRQRALMHALGTAPPAVGSEPPQATPAAADTPGARRIRGMMDSIGVEAPADRGVGDLLAWVQAEHPALLRAAVAAASGVEVDLSRFLARPPRQPRRAPRSQAFQDRLEAGEVFAAPAPKRKG